MLPVGRCLCKPPRTATGQDIVTGASLLTVNRRRVSGWPAQRGADGPRLLRGETIASPREKKCRLVRPPNSNAMMATSLGRRC